MSSNITCLRRPAARRLLLGSLAAGAAATIAACSSSSPSTAAGDVTGAVFPCGHWVAEESPELLLKHLLPFLG
jgi:hypothetical protein